MIKICYIFEVSHHIYKKNKPPKLIEDLLTNKQIHL